MADIPPISSATSVSSRFVSSDALEAARKQREADWKAAYERLGQEPPKPDNDPSEPYDGRSLWEKLNEQKTKKQEQFEETLKFKNQFRGLDDEELSFLDRIAEDNTEEEERRQAEIKEELESFRKAVTSKAVAPPPAALVEPAAPNSAAAQAPPLKKPLKKQKKTLPGLVVKKKTTATPAPAAPVAGEKREAPKEDKVGEDDAGASKKAKTA